MEYWLDIRLKIRNFFKKNKRIIYICLIAWAIMIGINYLLKNQKNTNIQPKTTLNVHKPVMNNGDKVPDSYKNAITSLIDDFIKYCNNKEYDNAYNLLALDYKEKFVKDKNEFIKYVDTKFKIPKIYNIQNYSNIDGAYVYRIRFMEDILASGTTNGYQYIEEKYAVKEENGSLRLALGGFIKEEDMNIQFEDNYMNINLTKKVIYYDRVCYHAEVTNKTDNYIVLLNQQEYSEIYLQVENEKRKTMEDLTSNVLILKNEKRDVALNFEKYADEKNEESKLVFDAVRILPKYTGKTSEYEKEKENATKLYSITINLKKDNNN